MLNKLIIAGLVFGVFLLQSCNSVTSKTVETGIPASFSQTPEMQKGKTITKQSGGKVEFKGVSFSYNSQVFGEVKVEEVAEFPLENEDDKPENVAPRHLAFKLKKADLEREVKIAVYPVDDFPRMYSINKSGVKAMEEQIRDLKRVLKDKEFRSNNEIPYLPFVDATQAFQTRVAHFSFQNGKGIIFLTQFNIEPAFINNEGLSYIFQGLTNDGKHYVLAEFPVTVAFLPKDFETREIDGYKLPDSLENKSDSKRYKDYIVKTEKRLDKLTQNEFTPNLKYYEEIISSLKIEK